MTTTPLTGDLGDLAIIDLHLDGEVVGPVSADHAHAVLCGWIDGDAHDAHRKPFTLRHLQVAEHEIRLQVSAMTVDTVVGLQAAVARSRRIRLGRSDLRCESASMVRNVSWPDLLEQAVAASGIDLHLATPTLFRSGSAVSVMPTPGLVFGHLRSVWSRWAPPSLQPDLDLASLRILVDHLAGTTSGARARHGTWHGFKGWVGFDFGAVSERDRRVLCALALLAPFSGVGANTTVGFGSATVDIRGVDTPSHTPGIQRTTRRVRRP